MGEKKIGVVGVEREMRSRGNGTRGDLLHSFLHTERVDNCRERRGDCEETTVTRDTTETQNTAYANGTYIEETEKLEKLGKLFQSGRRGELFWSFSPLSNGHFSSFSGRRTHH